MSDHPHRGPAEWASLGVSSLVLLVVVILILAQIPGEDLPAAPAAEVEQITTVDQSHHVQVNVRNRGDATAAQVQVVAELVVDDETMAAEQVIEFLSGGETHQLVFIFDHDPEAGELRTRVASFSIP